jgi:outer membrane protein
MWWSSPQNNKVKITVKSIAQFNQYVMKRIFLAVMFAGITAVCAHAQLFIGGSLGLDVQAGKSKTDGTSTDLPATFALNISPKAGYYLNDRFALGLELGFERTVTNNRRDPETKTFETTFGIGAFGRYHVVNADRVALILEGSLGYGTSKEKSKTGSTSTEDDPINSAGLFVIPVLSYSLTERLSIEASSDFLRFGAGRVWTKNDDSNYSSGMNYFGFGANSGDSELFQTAFGGAFSIGIVFKF